MLLDINNLSKNELNRFELFIQSKFHNTYGTVIKLFEYLKNLHPVKDEDIIKKKISAVVFNEKEVNNNKVWKLISDFEKLLGKFLVALTLEEDKPLNDLLLLRAYMKQGLKQKAKVLNNRIYKDFERSFVTNENAYSSYAASEEEYFYYLFGLNDNRMVNVYPKRTKTLDYLLVFKKLKNYFEEVICEVYMKADTKAEKNFYRDSLDFVDRNLNEIRKYHPVIYLYYLRVLFYENYNNRYIDLITDYHERNKKKFNADLDHKFNEVVITAYEKMQSKKIGDIDLVYIKLFDLYDDKYMKGKNLKNIKLMSYDFITITSISINLKRFDWTESFIEKYKNSIDDKFKDDCRNLCSAKLYFAKGNYESSLWYSKIVSRTVHHYYNTANFLILESYYEMKKPDKVNSVLKSLKQYLRRNRSLSEYDKMILSTFIEIFSDFLLVTINRNVNKPAAELADELIHKINNLKTTLDSRKWFLKKLSEITDN